MCELNQLQFATNVMERAAIVTWSNKQTNISTCDGNNKRKINHGMEILEFADFAKLSSSLGHQRCRVFVGLLWILQIKFRIILFALISLSATCKD